MTLSGPADADRSKMIFTCQRPPTGGPDSVKNCNPNRFKD